MLLGITVLRSLVTLVRVLPVERWRALCERAEKHRNRGLGRYTAGSSGFLGLRFSSFPKARDNYMKRSLN